MNNVLDGGAIARRFTENSKRFTGNKASGGTTASQMGNAIASATAQINNLAAQNSQDPIVVADIILRGSGDELAMYAQSHGETPNGSIDALISQCVLLRIIEITTISKATDLADGDALAEIEAAETEALNTDTADYVLAPNVQAALNMAIEYFQAEMNAAAGSKNLVQTVQLIMNQLNSSNGYNGDDITDPSTIDTSSISVADNFPTLSTAIPSINMQGAVTSNTDPASGVSAISTAAPSLTLSPATQASISQAAQQSAASTASGSSTPWTSILSGIASTASSINSAIKGIGTTTQAVTSNIGANSISTYLKNNPTQVIIYLLLALALLYFVMKNVSK